MLAARRIGELVPAGEHGGKGGGTKSKTWISSDIVPQRLTEFRKLAKIPLAEFKTRIEKCIVWMKKIIKKIA